jgi:hypothetical protein
MKGVVFLGDRKLNRRREVHSLLNDRTRAAPDADTETIVWSSIMAAPPGDR